MDPRESDNEQIESENPKTKSESDSLGQTAVVERDWAVPQQSKMAKTISDLQSLILVPWIIITRKRKLGTKKKNWDGNETLIGFEKGKWEREQKEGYWDNKMWRALSLLDGLIVII